MKSRAFFSHFPLFSDLGQGIFISRVTLLNSIKTIPKASSTYKQIPGLLTPGTATFPTDNCKGLSGAASFSSGAACPGVAGMARVAGGDEHGAEPDGVRAGQLQAL